MQEGCDFAAQVSSNLNIIIMQQSKEVLTGQSEVFRALLLSLLHILGL